MALDRLLLGFSLSQPVPRRQLDNLRKYRYNSVDNSLLSKYVLCHYWNALVKLFPLWMAPNLITLIGLLTTFISAALCVAYAPSLMGTLPSWLFFLIGASVWIYASLDAIDGKQARRTGQCGPLGELFDHGCDAINLSLMNLIFPLIYGIDVGWMFVITCFNLLLGFYVVTWDEYHTHVLYLTVISGPVEGTIVFTVSAILSGIYGQVLWAAPLSSILPILKSGPLASMQLKDVVPISLIIAGALTVGTSVFRVCKRRKHYAVLQIVPLLSFLVSAGVCLHLESSLWAHLTKLLLYVGFTFGHAVASLIIAHLTLTSPNLYEPAYLPSVICSLLCTLRQAGLIDLSNDQIITGLHVATIYTITTYILRAFVVIRQFTGFLGIYCLTIKPTKVSKAL